MKHSEKIDQIVLAINKLQQTPLVAIKSKYNPHFKNNYADLLSIWEILRKPLTTNGLAVVQTTEKTDDGSATIITKLFHTSGQWIEGELNIKPDRTGPQPLGAAITYARKYGLSAIVGIVTEDDDGEMATDRESVEQPTNNQTPSTSEKTQYSASPNKEHTEKQWSTIERMATRIWGNNFTQSLVNHARSLSIYAPLSEISSKQASNIITSLGNMKKNNAPANEYPPDSAYSNDELPF